MILQKAREQSFWVFDKLTGDKVGSHFNDITSHLNEGGEQAQLSERTLLSQLLTHAKKTTEFYLNIAGRAELEEFPVVNKNLIRDHYEQFISSAFEREQLRPVVTSGSTGTPFKVLQNADKVHRNTSDTLYFAQQAGYTLGQRLYYLKIWNEINKKGGFSSFVQNVVSVDVMDQSDAFFEHFVAVLNEDTTPKSFLGYASAFEALCHYLDRAGVKKVSSKVRSIITMSEALNSYTKQSMEKYFECEVVGRYSNVENGILGQQQRGGGESYYLNTASYYFELLKLNNNEPAELGQPGRIVVTDLFNCAMPMIRYDTGDVGIMDRDESGELVLKKIEGRRMDLIFDTRGRLVSSFVITNNMWKFTEIKQYQFVQDGSKSYYFKLNTNGSFRREQELIAEFKQYFGNDAKMRVEYVSEIPLLASGKRKKVVNVSD